MLVRLIKPIWGKPKLKSSDSPNSNFIREVKGPDVVEKDLTAEEIKEYNLAGYNVYYFPNSPSKKLDAPVQGKDIDQFNWVFVDMDLKDGVYSSKEEFLSKIEEFILPPTKVIDSGNGIHVYWKVSNLDTTIYMYIQLALISYFDTDKSIWTPLQLMRLENSYNTKDALDYKLAKTLEKYKTNNLYSSDEFLSLFPNLSEDNLTRINNHLEHLKGNKSKQSLRNQLDAEELPEKFKKLLTKNKLIRELFTIPEEVCGDRSSADFYLATLLYDENFSRLDSKLVLINTKKALCRTPASRYSYAENLVDKVYAQKPTSVALNIAQYEELNIVRTGDYVNGPSFLDCLDYKWRTKQLFGLVGSPGIGKTSLNLKIFYDMIKNNPDDDGIYIYFSLEMTAPEIIERWNKLTNKDPNFKSKLYIVTNESPTQETLHINLQDIYKFSIDTMNKTGKRVKAIAIDHIDIINPTIDLNKKYNFGLIPASYNQKSITLELEAICSKLKELAKSIDCFLIIQSQTTKARAQDGSVELGTDAAYGTAKFEWFCDYVVTCWQPLLPLYDQITTRVLAWKYAKIRETSANDPVKRSSKYLLHYDLDTGNLRTLTAEEYTYVLEKLEEIEKNKTEKKKEGSLYNNSPAAKILLKLINKP